MNRHTLVAVDVLDLFDQVLLGLAGAAELHHQLRVQWAVVQRRADFDLLAVLDVQVTSDRDRTPPATSPSLAMTVTLRLATDQLDAHDAGELGDLGRALRGAGLEELDDARQAVGDVALGRRHRSGR